MCSRHRDASFRYKRIGSFQVRRKHFSVEHLLYSVHARMARSRKQVDSITCTPRSSEESGINRANSDSSFSSTAAELALGTLRSKDTHTAITSRPFSSFSLLDRCLYIWTIITHLFVTFFPYVGLALIVGTPQSLCDKDDAMLTWTAHVHQRQAHAHRTCAASWDDP